MLQRGGDVDLLGALHHPVEDHVYEDVGARPAHPVAAVDDHGAGAAAVALINLPAPVTSGSAQSRGRKTYKCVYLYFVLPHQ